MSDYEYRDVEAEQQAGVDEFDRAYFRMFGRYPEESELRPPDRRREAIQALVEQGATEGEREAARLALERIEADEYGDAVTHGAA